MDPVTLNLAKKYANEKLAGVFDAYDSTKGYTKEEYVIESNIIYEANQDIAQPAGDFDPSKWNATNFSDVAEGKTNKVASATSGDFAGLDSDGNLTDSGKKPSDFVEVSSALSIQEVDQIWEEN